MSACPSAWSLYLKEEQARKLQLPYQSRSALAREMVDFVAAQLPQRQVRVLGDGGYATKDYLHQLPPTVDVVGRRLITGKLYAPAASARCAPAGLSPEERPAPGVPQNARPQTHGVAAPSHRSRSLVQAWEGLWQAVLPGHLLRVGWCAVPRRPVASSPVSVNRPHPWRPFSPLTSPSVWRRLLAQYRERWAVEITIRDSNAFTGFGQDQCRKYERVVGANTLRLSLAAARTLWFVAQASRTDTLDLTRYRPWYRHKQAPSQLDIVWACREALQNAGVFPIPRFTPVWPIFRRSLKMLSF